MSLYCLGEVRDRQAGVPSITQCYPCGSYLRLEFLGMWWEKYPSITISLCLLTEPSHGRSLRLLNEPGKQESLVLPSVTLLTEPSQGRSLSLLNEPGKQESIVLSSVTLLTEPS